MARNKKIRKPVMGEVAVTTGGRDVTRGLMHGLLPPQDEVLLLKGRGSYELYESIRSDPQVATCLQTRFASVVGCERDVFPAEGGGVLEEEAARHLKAQLDVWWDTAADKHLNGIFYGFSFAELIYGVDNGRYIVQEVRVRNRQRFRFWNDLSPRLITPQNWLGEELPPNKFWVFSAGADNHDEPYGRGLAHYLYWPVFLKRNGLRFWSIFLEKFGQPTAVGKYQPGATEDERTKLLQAVDAIRTQTGVTLPDGMMIEFLEARRSGTADYSAFVRHMDGYISKVILGHASAADSTPGKLGGEDGVINVAAHILKADADLLCESFNRGPARWLTDWNFRGAGYPRLWLATEPAEDTTAQVAVDEKLFAMGYRLRPEAVIQRYGDYYEQVEPPAPAPQVAPAPAQFAEPVERVASDDPEAIASVLASRANPLVEAWLAVIKKRLEEGEGDLADFAEALDAIELNPTEMAALMGEAMALSRLVGRSNA